MSNIKLTLSFIGTNFSGWQYQPNYRTVEGEIRKVLDRLYKNYCIAGCSRTDRGVHAREYIANFKVKENRIPLNKLKDILNNSLPDDISILNVEEANETFHSTKDSKEKVYIYRITSEKNPFLVNVLYYPKFNKINIDYLKEAISYFIGEYDFYTFSKKDEHRDNNENYSYICKITEADITLNKNILEIKFRGNRFLYNMVRKMVGTLIYIGENKLSPDYIKYALKKRDRSSSKQTFPARGLTLEKVIY